MTLEEYKAKIDELGVDRGALAKGFTDSGITINKPHQFLPKKMGTREDPAAVEDLTHLNPKNGCGKKTRAKAA